MLLTDPYGLQTTLAPFVRACLKEPTYAARLNCLKLIMPEEKAIQHLQNAGQKPPVPVPPGQPGPLPAPVPTPSPQPPVILPTNDPIQVGPLIIVGVIREVVKCLENQRPPNPPNPPYPPMRDPNRCCLDGEQTTNVPEGWKKCFYKTALWQIHLTSWVPRHWACPDCNATTGLFPRNDDPNGPPPYYPGTVTPSAPFVGPSPFPDAAPPCPTK